MGQMWTAYVTNPDTAPDLNNLPTFDPEYGFPDGRPEREMVASQEEMNMARVPMDKRDFCAHFYIAFLKCRRDNFPNLLNCRHAKHEYDHCEYEDFVIRMKEYERERRLLERGKRKRLVAEREALED
ncbi:NADH dehydrogenase [ubiquinone] 1 beta subcomplex subunit 7 [Strongylocentrotus purpuratus]|uniref:NADH dehydrogenase [ubiquinone] 1 beta subcomplex subunit 7 n=1 Tax=Strongylocentrotus purpuratus TaxID=7668 RepID=A0A7M7RBD0_STRPU|nr:NADH dehydrogenase [ubiquinone] 1 beta subcomplex subunit 7 [Strongylocentrotus purpuratus]|eukprot:XP_784178.1 PREDICTED: NADH dehydrogenase [ubiquinone] 1 beta subcomplex subunit 7 [Strongylocentrotus purpuratus]